MHSVRPVAALALATSITEGDSVNRMTDEDVTAVLDGIGVAVRKAVAEGRNVEWVLHAGMIETAPVNNYVTRKATGEKIIQIFIGPERWSPDHTD